MITYEEVRVLEMEDSDERFTAWMRGNLDRAAAGLSLTITGAPVFGWKFRSIGAPAVGSAGGRWLRVVSEYPRWARGDGWTGNTDANSIALIAKPRVWGVAEWDDGGRRQRAEAMSLLPGRAVSPTALAYLDVDLPEQWWQALRGTLDHLGEISTIRMHADPDTLAARTTERLGRPVRISRWHTVHGDLHWSNLMQPAFGLLDWELWGRGPLGTDAASLLCHSLLVPALADRVRDTFGDVLESPSGRAAQLVAGARLLGRIAGGDHPELAGPLRQHLSSLEAGTYS